MLLKSATPRLFYREVIFIIYFYLSQSEVIETEPRKLNIWSFKCNKIRDT